jgi:hypothetical protein
VKRRALYVVVHQEQSKIGVSEYNVHNAVEMLSGVENKMCKYLAADDILRHNYIYFEEFRHNTSLRRIRWVLDPGALKSRG